MAIRDRIKELRRVPASELQAHPRNWRTHPEYQRLGTRKRVASPKDGEVLTLPPKHRYLYPLDDDIRAIVEKKRLPYPKRQKDSSEPSAHRAEEGGAAPTLALQE